MAIFKDHSPHLKRDFIKKFKDAKYTLNLEFDFH